MKLFLVVATLAVAAEAYVPIFYDYHEEIGIKLAEQIIAAERAMDFDGSRISGGSPSSVGAHPHMGGMLISLTNNRQSVCGSSLLSNTRGVTAAHCWRHRANQGRSLTIRYGTTQLTSGGTRVDTSQVEMHAGYNENSLNYDVAIIRINHVAFTNNIRAIPLETGTDQFVGTWATAAGFGRTSDAAGAGVSQSLNHVSLQVITNAVCQRTFGSATVRAMVICVAAPNGRSTCAGDSGGPLAVGTNADNRRLIGVTSFGHIAGCTLGHPAGFVRVTSVAAWLQQRM